MVKSAIRLNAAFKLIGLIKTKKVEEENCWITIMR